MRKNRGSSWMGWGGEVGLLLLATQVNAQFLLLNDNRSVSVSGPGYSQSQSPSGAFAPFSGNVSGSGGVNPYLSSSAAQYSTITTNAIVVSNTVYGFYSYSASGNPGNAFASNICEIAFNVSSPAFCRLSGVEYGVGDIMYVFTLSLSSAHHGTIASVNYPSQPWTFLGVLQPDTYMLNMDMPFEWSAYYNLMYPFDQGRINANCTLVAIPPPAITSNPQSTTAAPGATASFSAAGTGDSSAGPIAYQWLFKGTNIAGATNSVLTVTNVSSASVGPYTVLATNLAGSTLSSPAYLSLLTANMYAGLTIVGNVGSLYRIDYRNSLTTNDWIVLTYLVLPSSPYTFFDTNSINSSRTFYRAMIQ